MLELVTADKLQLDIFSVFGTNNGLLMAGDKNDARVMTIGWANPGPAPTDGSIYGLCSSSTPR